MLLKDFFFIEKSDDFNCLHLFQIAREGKNSSVYDSMFVRVDFLLSRLLQRTIRQTSADFFPSQNEELLKGN
jgi:hypothetical protein